MSTIHLTERKLVARFPLLLLCATLTATGQENAVVESLLSNGKKQVAAGDLEAGCRSFEQAIQAQQKANLPKHPRLHINLANCREQQGRLASAWAEYIEAQRLSRTLLEQDASEKKRLEYIDKKLKKLEPRLSFLLVVMEKKIPELEVTRNGVAIPEEVKIPVDPGEYLLVAKAPGYQPWSSKISFKKEGSTETIKIPPLVKEPTAAASANPPAASASAPPPPQASASAPASAPASGVTTGVGVSTEPPLLASGSTRATAGWIVGGAGLLVSGIGLFLGSRAISTYQEAKTLCPERKLCSPEAMELRKRADSQANVANLVVGGGLVALGVGTYLLLTSSSAPHQGRGPRGGPWVSGNGAGFLVQEQF
jgi:hypothetical protein